MQQLQEKENPGSSGEKTEIVFVYGALRSGTTMLHLMLDCHPDIDNPGEADFLFDHLHPDPEMPGGWRYDRDRLERDRIFRGSGIDLPENREGLDLLGDMLKAFRRKGDGRITTLNVHRHAAKIARALPDARFIHILRDPRDVARSSVRMGWAGNSYFASRSWRGTEEDWDRAGLSDERVLTVRFEDLMQDLEGELSRITGFLGLPFETAMLDYHLSSTYGPPDPKIAQQWRRKASPREIALIEVAVGPLMAARGYPPEHPRGRPGRLEHGALTLDHRVRRWRFNIRRFGLPLFLGHHLARRLGLEGLERRLGARKEEIVIRNQK